MIEINAVLANCVVDALMLYCIRAIHRVDIVRIRLVIVPRKAGGRWHVISCWVDTFFFFVFQSQPPSFIEQYN